MKTYALLAAMAGLLLWIFLSYSCGGWTLPNCRKKGH